MTGKRDGSYSGSQGVAGPRLLAALLVAVVVIGACGDLSPSPSPTLPPAGSQTSVILDRNWTASNGRFVFSGSVDPDGIPSRVILEIASGSASPPDWQELSIVADQATAFQQLRFDAVLPLGVESCVRLSVVNEAGAWSSAPLCIRVPEFAEPSVGPSG